MQNLWGRLDAAVYMYDNIQIDLLEKAVAKHEEYTGYQLIK